MSLKVSELQDFLSSYDPDERVFVHGVRDGLKYHFHELYGKDKPTITVCVEGTRDYDSVQFDIEQEEKPEFKSCEEMEQEIQDLNS